MLTPEQRQYLRSLTEDWAGDKGNTRRWAEALIQGASETTGGDNDWDIHVVRQPSPYEEDEEWGGQYQNEAVVLKYRFGFLLLHVNIIYPQSGILPPKHGPHTGRSGWYDGVGVITDLPHHVRLIAEVSSHSPRELVNVTIEVGTEEERDAAIQRLSNPTFIMHTIAKELREAIDVYRRDTDATGPLRRDADQRAYDYSQQTRDRFNPKTGEGEPQPSMYGLGPKVRR